MLRKRKKIFFLDARDGNEFSTDEMEGEDSLGWLIPEDRADEFTSEFEVFKESEDWDDFYMTVDCAIEDSLNYQGGSIFYV